MDQDPKSRILRKLDSIPDLPSLPEVVTVLEKAMASPYSSAESIAGILTDEPAITTKLLRAANSPLYSFSGSKIEDVRRAVTRLGFQEVHNMVLAITTINLMKGLNNIDYRSFWHHAITVAFSTKALAGFYKKKKLDEPFKVRAFTAALLHDIGILVLDQYFAQDYKAVLDSAVEGGDIPLYGLEREALGITHGEVGAYLLKRWGLGEEIISAVAMHHTPGGVGGDRSMVELVHITNFVANNQGINNGTPVSSLAFADSAWEDLGLSLDDTMEIIDSVRKEAEKSPILMAISG